MAKSNRITIANRNLFVIIEKKGFVLLNLRVVPRASKSEIVGEHDGALKVRIASPPVDGAANDEVVRFMAKALGVSRSAISIVTGSTSKTKQLRIDGLNAGDLKERLGI